ncbi:MAG: hypothetical protein ACI30J_06690 [Paludibacteraceae bacterium]
MGKITFSFPVETMAGSISKNDHAFAVRYRNGRPFTYTYTRTAPWSDKQHSTRALFGATSYFVHLILRLDNAAEPLTVQMNKAKTKARGKGKTYNLLSGFVSARLRALLLQDDDLRTQALAAYEQYCSLARPEHGVPASPAQIEALKTTQLPLADTLLTLLLSPAE